MKKDLYTKEKIWQDFIKRRMTHNTEYELSSGIVLDKFGDVISIWTINIDCEKISISCPICEKEFDIGNNNMEDFHYCPNCGNPMKFLSNIRLE